MREVALIIHNVRSVHNVASMFRSASCAGATRVVLTGYTPEPFDRFGAVRPDFAKVALGAEQSVPWSRFAQAGAAIRRLRDEGFFVVAVEQSGDAVPYHRLASLLRGRKADKVAILVGNEVRGVPASVIGRCDLCVEIPMQGRLSRDPSHARHRGGRTAKESLNVTISAAIVLFRVLYP